MTLLRDSVIEISFQILAGKDDPGQQRSQTAMPRAVDSKRGGAG